MFVNFLTMFARRHVPKINSVDHDDKAFHEHRNKIDPLLGKHFGFVKVKICTVYYLKNQ